eukprot:TRINITY_DN2803_c0_g1_i1.p1 TRINITY_DN2803_c0_g1~~TRINITY_DN2803_c0_g1_i1.p1  ORF type:complete len:549 (+),score=161.14 TRINITY_DN2803_c0_g1_i1:147-1793(+)
MAAGGAVPAGRTVTLVDYGAGNVRSVVNAVRALGWEVHSARTAADIEAADKLIFPGVGAFGACMERMQQLGFSEPVKRHIAAGKPFFGICLGMQTLFESSAESPGVAGLGVIPAKVSAFAVEEGYSVPHMGWNGVRCWKRGSALDGEAADRRYYFVHSYVADAATCPPEWILTTTDYGGQRFVSSVQRGACIATQFHPEKSAQGGLDLLRRFLEPAGGAPDGSSVWGSVEQPPTALAKRIIACLDVRSNDQGDVVVTKGDQYDVREKDEGREVRNLGRPVELAERYYKDGADEITFLNITSFRSCPATDQPMLEVLRQASERIFVPLCVGGGIRACTDPDGTEHSALDVAGLYFRSGADKVSLGTDAVDAATTFRERGCGDGTSSIETISRVYGRQAVVISVDPKRQYVAPGAECKHHTFPALEPGPAGETHCWYQCTVKGGRETRDLGAYELVQACESLGAGEILLNCIDKDGTNSGFDTAFVADVKRAVRIPVIASSGAGKVDHFSEVFRASDPDAALAAGIFHRGEVAIRDVKGHLRRSGIPVRE